MSTHEETVHGREHGAAAALLPEQQRALAYARRRGSEAPIAEIRTRVSATYRAIEEWIGAVDARIAKLRPAEGGWSVQEVVDHLIESDRPAAAQLAQLLAGRSVAEPIPASLQSAQPLAADWSAARDELHRVHRQVLGVLDTADDGVPLTATAAVAMVVKCTDADGAVRPVHWTERFDWKAFAILLHAHNREHLAQLERIRGSLQATSRLAPPAGEPPLPA